MSHCKLIIKPNSIGIIEWDHPHSSANVLSFEVIKELQVIIEEIKKNNLKAVILISKKPSVFIAGADINEIQKTNTKEEFKKVLIKAHQCLKDFENLSACKIAVIHGACLGGGTELALAFDYRLGSDSSKTQIGLPEVKLGLIPGFGGCIRFPRLVGLIQGLNFILTGKSFSSKKAKRLGFLYDVMPLSILETQALDLANQVIEGKKPAHPSQIYKPKNLVFKLLEIFGKPLIYHFTKKNILKETKGFYPAPLKALEVIKNTYKKKNFDQALEVELEGFCEVALTEESHNLVNLFFMMEELKKQNGSSFKNLSTQISETENQNIPIKKAGVLGAGIMGGGIAYLLADKHYPVRLKDISYKACSKALKQAHQLWDKQKKIRKIDKYEYQKRSSFLSASLDYQGFSTLDIVIEAVSEDPNIKQKIIKEVSPYLTENTIFVSNTSSLSISKMSEFLSLS